MKIHRGISIVLAIECIIASYAVIPLFIATYSSATFVPYIASLFLIALLVISVLGIFFEKKWGVLALWVFIFTPFFRGETTSFMVFIGGGYYFTVINTMAATYLTTVSMHEKAKNPDNIDKE